MIAVNSTLPVRPRWLMAFALLAALTIVYATQLVLAGNIPSWPRALWQETVYWTAWSILAAGIFSLCHRLHAGPSRWPRYVAFLLLGAVAVAVLHPLLYQALRFGTAWVGWKLHLMRDAPAEFFPAWRRSSINLLGPGFVLYAGTVMGWHALRFYHDLTEKQVKSAELEAMLRQAQLHALRSQLNPHFLFNTLHSIAELVHEDPPRAEKMLLQLAALLRQALNSANTVEVPLAEELQFVKGYLEIEQLRLGERLCVTWDIAPESLPARVPALLLQPIVENAIQHAIAPSPRPGTLLIRARRENDCLQLHVSDNGPGLNRASQKPSGIGIGLANTRARLQRLHGAQHRFELIDENGLTVRMRLPFSTTAEERANAA